MLTDFDIEHSWVGEASCGVCYSWHYITACHPWIWWTRSAIFHALHVIVVSKWLKQLWLKSIC